MLSSAEDRKEPLALHPVPLPGAVEAPENSSERTNKNAENGKSDDDFVYSDPFVAYHEEPNVVLRLIHNVWGKFRYFLAHSVREMRKRKFNYGLGVLSCFLVVVVAAIAYTMIAKAPVVFLAQGENDNGQIDMKLTPADGDSPFLNYTQIVLNTKFSDEFSYHAPRQAITGFGYNAVCTERINAINLGPGGVSSVNWRYDGPPDYPACTGGSDCMPTLCPESTNLKSLEIMVLNSEMEKKIGLGRLWPFDSIPSGKALVDSNTASRRGLKKGDTMWLTARFNAYDNPLFSHIAVEGMQGLNVSSTSATQFLEILRDRDTIVFPVEIWNVFSDSKGKFESGKKDYIVMEFDPFLSYLKEHVHYNISQYVVQTTSGHTTWSDMASRANLYHFVKIVNMNFPPDRVTNYISTNYDVIQGQVIKFTSRALYYIGFPEVEVTLGILSTLSDLRFFTLYLGLILSIILTILFILSTMLIYSLLIISIETRTFELGIHRMVGMTRFSVVEMLLTQALSYAIPAWVVGLFIAQVGAYMVLSMIETSVEVPVNKQLTADAVTTASILGLLIPLVASTIPIRNALGKNLQESLDTQHSKTQAVEITVERSEDEGLGTAWMVLGLGLVVFGFLIYYLLPLSLLTFNLALFFNIFFGILLGMLFGLILLSLNAQHLLEKLVTAVCFWWEARSIRTIVIKNLIAHRIRNRKTTIMYALSLGFIIFITVAFSMELTTAAYRLLRVRGTEFRLRATNDDKLFDSQMIAKLEAVSSTDPAVKDFAWTTAELQDTVSRIDSVTLTNLGHIMESSTEVIGVSPNFYDVSNNEFFIASDSDSSTGLTLTEQLYTVRGSQSMMIGASLRKSHNLKTLDRDSSFLSVVRYKDQENSPAKLDFFRLMPLAYLESAPYLFVSRFPTGRQQAGTVSFSTYLRLANGTIPSMEQLPMKNLLVRFHDSATDAQKDVYSKKLQDLMDQNSEYEFELWDFRDTRDALNRTNNAMQIIFTAATYIAMGLCLFSLMASMYTNIFEQSKEIAILRAMGLRRWQLVRIYIYEAFVLVLSASILGIMIGCIMAWTMAAQRVLFTQLPVPVQFPFWLLAMVIIAASFCAVIAAWGPARALVKRPVSQVMRTVI